MKEQDEIQKVKDSIAIKSGYKDWSDFFFSSPPFSMVEKLMEMVAHTRYEQGWKDGYKRGQEY